MLKDSADDQRSSETDRLNISVDQRLIEASILSE